MKNFKIDELVLIKSTNEVAKVLSGKTDSMGNNYYYLDSNHFSTGYPFYEEDLTSVEQELDNCDYYDYLEEVYNPSEGILFEGEVGFEESTDMKYDQGKIRHSLLVPEFIEELLGVLEFGASKYEEESWKGIDEKRYADAMYRHFLAYSKGEELDTESSYNHMAHIAANALFIFWKMQQESK